MKKKKIAMLFGGCSPEYSVSLQSAYSVIGAINKDEYEPIMIGIAPNGAWYHYVGDLNNLLDDSWLKENCCNELLISLSRDNGGLLEKIDGELKFLEVDALFPILHGKNGEDGTIQGLADLLNIPLIGCGMLSSALCMDKYVSHELANYVGVKTAKSVMVNTETTFDEIIKMTDELNYPLYIKPVRAGSSYGISKITEVSELEQALKEAFNFDTMVIIEENVDGREVGCAIIGTNNILIGSVDEIENNNEFFSFEEKYNSPVSKIVCPAKVDDNVSEKIKEAAKLIYRTLQCEDFARIDMFLTNDNEIYFNEINTIPGFTSHSRYPNMLKTTGLTFEEIVDKIIKSKIK